MTEAEKEKYKAYDRMMRAVPNMKPRYSGIMIPPTPENELSIRIRDGTAARDEVFSETFKSIRRKDFKKRLARNLLQGCNLPSCLRQTLQCYNLHRPFPHGPASPRTSPCRSSL